MSKAYRVFNLKQMEWSFSSLGTREHIYANTNWILPFELMCDASNVALRAVLGQKLEKASHVIHYASKCLDDAQRNYTTTEKELLAIIFTLEKF